MSDDNTKVKDKFLELGTPATLVEEIAARNVGLIDSFIEDVKELTDFTFELLENTKLNLQKQLKK